MHNAITVWLASNRPYDAGVQLYAAHGHDRLLQRLFAEGWSEFKEQRLAEALAQLVTPAGDLESDTTEVLANQVNELENENEDLNQQVYDLEEVVEELETANNQLSTTNDALRKAALATPKGWPPVMDATVQVMYDEWLPLFKERKDLQARILDVALAGEHDEARQLEAGAMAHRILDLRDACQRIYKHRNTYMATGMVPPAEPPLPNLVTDPKKHPKCLANHERYLRDYKAKLKDAKPEDLARITGNVNLQQRYVDHYKKLLS